MLPVAKRAFLAGLAALILGLAAHPAPLLAQGTLVSIGSGGHDTGQPVEITADEFRLDQTAGTATFLGNVLVIQGDMRLSAATLTAEYSDGADGRRIERLLASGGVTVVAGNETAEAAEAVHEVDSGSLRMQGDVMLTQGPAFITGDALTVDLRSGSGTMSGRVRTLFQPRAGTP